MVVRRNAPHTRALLDNRSIIGDCHTEKSQTTTAAAARRARSGIVPVVATMRATPRHSDPPAGRRLTRSSLRR